MSDNAELIDRINLALVGREDNSGPATLTFSTPEENLLSLLEESFKALAADRAKVMISKECAELAMKCYQHFPVTIDNRQDDFYDLEMELREALEVGGNE